MALSGVLSIGEVLVDVVGHSTFVVDQNQIRCVHQVVGGIRVLGGLVRLEHTGVFVIVGLTRSNDLIDFPEVLMGDEAGVGALVDQIEVTEGRLVIPLAEPPHIPGGDVQPIGAVPIDPTCESTTTRHTNNRHQ